MRTLYNKIIRLVQVAGLICLGACAEEYVVSTDTLQIDVPGVAAKLLEYRDKVQQTDLIATSMPDLDRDTAIAIQLSMLEQEISRGAKHVGWKMGGTGASNAADFDPSFGYVLESNLVQPGGDFSLSRAPTSAARVEAEVGFVLSRDLPDGVATIEELRGSIAYVTGAVEIVQQIAVAADGGPAPTNDVIASGLAQLAVIQGDTEIPLDEYGGAPEVARCLVDGELATEGTSTKIWGGPLNALFALANLLPQHGEYLKAGQIVVTGSLYSNPTVDSEARVQLEFSTLGNIDFTISAAE